MAEQRDEAERHRAIELYESGVAFEAILREMRRSRAWLAKWLRRFREEGASGLRSRPRTPQRQPRKTSQRILARVVAIREELERRRSRRARFAGTGAEVIRAELARRRVHPLPSLSTIERILRRSGYPKRAPRRRPSTAQEPYPAPRRARPGDLQQTDLVGPRHLRGPRGVTRFYSVHTLAVVGRAVATTQGRHKTAELLCAHFLRAWRALGVPRVSQIDNEMATSGGARHPYGFSLLMRLHLLLGVRLLFIPPGEPGRNSHIESFNALWQERVLWHPCPDLRALRRTDEAFLRYYHFGKAHRALSRTEDGTRYPGPWLARHRRALRALPRGFILARYRDARGRLRLPLARGRISFIRRVDEDGRIEINGKAYGLRRSLARQYVTATIFTHRRLLVVRGERFAKRFPFPIHEPVGAPLLPLPRGRL